MSYLIVKALHIISVIAWMAAILYLPRLFVYHAEYGEHQTNTEMLLIMERRLLKAIMTPAMIASLIFGFILFWMIGFDQMLTVWGMVKLAAILAMMVIHFRLAWHYRLFAGNANSFSSKYFRIVNEVPTVLLIVIVFMAILKPGG